MRKLSLHLHYILVGVIALGLLAGLSVVSLGKDTLVIGITTDPRGIFPGYACTFQDWVVGYRVYSGLFQADENFEPVPDLAQSWEVSADGLTYTFHLKRFATFHDGTPITSADVIFSVMEISVIYGSVCNRGPGNVIASTEAPDDHTVVFHLNQPFPEMLNPYSGLGGMCSGIVKKELYEGTDLLTNPYNFDPVGSGPFKFVEWVRGSHIILERYDGFHGDVAGIEKIVFRIVGDPISRAMAFESGEIDWIPSEFPASEVARMNALPGNNVFFHGTPCGNIVELTFNLRREPFDNREVRKALTAAINREKILNLVYFGGGTVGTGHVPLTEFSAWWHNPDALQIEYNPELTKQMLDHAGYPVQADGWRFHTTLIHTTSYTEHLKVAELIKDDFRKIGVDLQIISLDNAAWHEHFFKNWDFDMSIWPCCGGPNPPTLLRWTSANIKPISWANAPGFSNEEYDSLYTAMATEVNREKRIGYAHRLQEILVEEQALGYLLHRRVATAVKEGLFTEEPKNVWNLGYMWMHLNKIQPIGGS